MPLISKVSKKRYSWAAPGDVNAFFGLMLDNIADLVLTVGLLTAIFGFPAIFALRYMVPGTAIGVLVGDLLFFAMALRVARRTGRNDITAMPLGLDTPSTFGMVFFVLGPAFLTAKFEQGLSEQAAASYAWHIGICCIVISGVFKLLCACGSQWVRNLVPRAGLLGSLTAIALVLICFLPLLDILQYPVVGLAALAVILTTLVAKVAAPLRIPGALAALLVGGTIYYVMASQGWLGAESAGTLADPAAGLFPTEWTTAFRFEWMAAWGDALRYLPIVIPFALATVIGGIDCTESAAAAGDEFDTNQVIGVEAIATLVAGLCGGVIQSTPYIGHPAYKAMGGPFRLRARHGVVRRGCRINRILRRDVHRDSEVCRFPDPGLHRHRDHRTEFSRHANQALSRIGDRVHSSFGRTGRNVCRSTSRPVCRYCGRFESSDRRPARVSTWRMGWNGGRRCVAADPAVRRGTAGDVGRLFSTSAAARRTTP